MATDLIRYLAEEVAADGLEGSSWERINSFIDNYVNVSSSSSSSSSEKQLIDEDLRRYVIEALTRLPTISPGRFVSAVEGSGSKSSIGKGKERQQVDLQEESGDNAEESKVIKGKGASSGMSNEQDDYVELHEEDKGLGIRELLAKYGAQFRLIADRYSIDAVKGNAQECSAAASQLFYFVMRKRGDGVSFTEIGEVFGYNASTTFFLVKTLCDIDLAIKFRAHNGKSLVSWIVAKRYAHLCRHLTSSLQDGSQQNNNDKEGVEGGEDDEADEGGLELNVQPEDIQPQEMSSEAVDEMIRKSNRKNQDKQEEDEADGAENDIDGSEEDASGGQEEGQMTTLHGLLAYPTLPNAVQEVALFNDRGLVRMRILTLLKSSKNNATIRADLVVRIGIKEPVKSQRKIFNATLRQMETEGLIERCLLKRPLHRDKDHTEPCWMATTKGIEHCLQISSSNQQQEIKRMRSHLLRELESNKSKMSVEKSFNRQILEKVESCQRTGITIERLNAELGGNTDQRRNLDHILGTFKKPSNPHYEDFTLFSALEQSGRKRSQRFWTRQWRPSKVAPHEAREVDAERLASWIGMPDEESFLTVEQWRQKAPKRNVKRKAKIKVDKNDSDSSTTLSPAKKARRSEREISVAKGRPRKDFSKAAQRAAERYQLKKAQREREDEERRGVEDLLGEQVAETSQRKVRKTAATTTRKRASRPRTSHHATGFSTKEDQVGKSQSQMQSEESQTQATNVDVDLPDASDVLVQSKDTELTLDPALAAATQSTQLAANSTYKSQNLPTDKRSETPAKSTARANRPKKESLNLTLQLKYDTLQQFFREKQIIESAQFESEYKQFVRSIAPAEVDLQQYDMDRKVRYKLLDSLERRGFLKLKKVAAPVLSKGSQRQVWHISDIEEAKLIAFCRQVSEGTVHPIRKLVTTSGKQQPVLESNEIDMPDILKQYYKRRARAERDSIRKRVGRPAIARPSRGERKAAVKTRKPVDEARLQLRQAKALRKKAVSVRKERLSEFDNAIETCFNELDIEENARKIIMQGLNHVRKEYGQGEVGITLKRVRQIFDEVLRVHHSGDRSWNNIVNRRKIGRCSSSKRAESVGHKNKEKGGARQRKAVQDWTKARDELLRDAVVILRCRDRYRNPLNPRKNWSALEQIFPDSSPSSRVARYEFLRKAVGEEAYLNQLEAEWDMLWTEFRGTEELEDINPADPNDFDLMGHIQFLRTHIDKLAVADKVDNETGDPLPLDIRKMLPFYDYERPPHTANDPFSTLARFATSETSMEDRGRLLRGHALTLNSNLMGFVLSPEVIITGDSLARRKQKRERGIAIAIIKIIHSTSEAAYKEDVATKFCRDNAEEETLGKAIIEMQDMKVIKRKEKEERQLPNRNFTLTQEYNDFHEDALETLPFWTIAQGYQKVVQKGRANIFQVNDDEESAACVVLLSEDRAKVSIDLNVVESIKKEKLFNAKNIHDDHLELPVEIHIPPSSSRSDGEVVKRWTRLLDLECDREAVLRWLNDGVESLPSRLEKSWKQWIGSFKGEKQTIAKRLHKLLNAEVGSEGINKESLLEVCPSKHLQSLVQSAEKFKPPLVFQSGYEEGVLVSSRYLSKWTIHFGSSTFRFPFKWYDIHGDFLVEIWKQSLQLVIHAIITRPGITRAQLIVQFRIAMDRTEICRIVQFACQAGVIEKVLSCNQTIRGEDAEWEARNDREIALMAL